MNKFTEIIDRYLSGQMSADEKKDFEKQLQTNAELKAEFELQKQVMKGVQRSGMKNATQSGLKKASIKSKLLKVGVALVIAGAVCAVAWIAKEKLFSGKENIRYELNEENKKQWADADKYLSPQVYKINGAQDTVIETEGGIVVAIPAGAFYNKMGDEVKDNIEIEIKEALNPAAIMQAGLSTISDGKLLETGGMFYINARQNGENLAIAKNKGINVNVPTDKKKEGMMLFEGKRLDNGQINWIDPKPLENNLNTVDILSLNFYPPHFLDTVKAFGFDIRNKRLTDSVYYSLECQYGDSAPSAPAGGNGKVDTIKREGMVTVPVIPQLASSATTLADKLNTRSSDAKGIFRQNCAVCHTLTDKKLTGPGLAGIKERVPKGDWLFNYIKNNEKMIKTGDPYANKIYKEYGTAMTVFEGTLSDNDIRALIEYITYPPTVKIENTPSSSCEIAPSRIRAIWDQRYNNTILATSQFAERLQVIFQTCNSGIFNLYVNNLDHKLNELDEEAARMCPEKPECQKKFLEFAQRMDGGVSIEQTHMKKLNAYFEEKSRIYKEATLKALREMYSEEDMQNMEAQERREVHAEAETNREQKVLSEEIILNMKEAYRQLGKRYIPTPPPTPAYYGATIVSTGWKNVDAYVIESTITRTTLDYTDTQTGRKAVIRYVPLTVTVNEFTRYDRVFAYLLPDKLTSFQRINATNKVFRENLNELMNYDLVVLGFKGKDVYFKQITDVKPGELQVSLDAGSQLDVDALLNRHKGSHNETDFIKELKYQVMEQEEEIRQSVIKKREEITLRLKKVVFPCLVIEDMVSEKDPLDKEKIPMK